MCASARFANYAVLGSVCRMKTPGGWLFDETVNLFMYVLQQRDRALVQAKKDKKPSHFFNSFFMEKVNRNSLLRYILP